MMKVKVIKPSRLNGVDVAPGEEVEIPDSLAEAWLLAGRAKVAVQKGPGRPPKAKTPEGQEGLELVQMSKNKLVAMGKELGIDPKEFKGLNKEEIAAKIEEVMGKDDEQDESRKGQEGSEGSQNTETQTPA